MGRFTVIPQDTFEAMQLDTGVLLKQFDPEHPADPADEDIICATTGGITVKCQPKYSDLGSDVDNCPENMMEYKHLDGWDCGISTSGLGTSPDLIRLSLGAADVSGHKITPRRKLLQTDFTDIWWVGDRADGGLVACRLMHALSTGGFQLKTTKNGKGQTTIDLTGHVSVRQQNVVPMEFYSDSGPDASLSALTISGVTLSPAFSSSGTAYSGTTSSATGTITATATDNNATVSILNGSTAVTNGNTAAWATGTNTVTITVTNGDASVVYTVNVQKTE